MWIGDWYPRFSFALTGMHTHGYVSSHKHAHICTKELLTEETEGDRKERCAQPPGRAQQGGSGAALRALAQDSLDCVPSAIPFVSCIIRLNLSVTQFSHAQSRNNIYFLGVLRMITCRTVPTSR